MNLTNINNTSLMTSYGVMKNEFASNEKSLEKLSKTTLDTTKQLHTSSQLALNVTNSSNQIASLQSLKNDVKIQLNAIDDFQTSISQNGGFSPSHMEQMVSAFTSIIPKDSIERISMIIEEKQSEESRSYFDGIVGSKPISTKEIFELIDMRKSELAAVNKYLNDKITQSSQNTKEMFSQEQEKVSHKMNFEQEVVSFDKNTLKELSGSMVTTQANAEPRITEQLLVS